MGNSQELVEQQRYEIVVPGTGQVVDASDEVGCAMALASVVEFEMAIKAAKQDLYRAIEERSRVLGSKTIPLPDGRKAVVKSGPVTEYDAEAIEVGLREMGMPEERIRQIVVEEVRYKVSAVEAKRAAGANPVYAEIIDANRREVEKPPYVSIVR
jgi:hypothetical protein